MGLYTLHPGLYSADLDSHARRNSGAPEYVPNTLPDGSVTIESMSYFVINSQLAVRAYMPNVNK